MTWNGYNSSQLCCLNPTDERPLAEMPLIFEFAIQYLGFGIGILSTDPVVTMFLDSAHAHTDLSMDKH